MYTKEEDTIETTTLPPATTTTMSTVSTTSAILQNFEASLTVVNASSVYDDNYEKYGPEQALTPVSQDGEHFWHSSFDDRRRPPRGRAARGRWPELGRGCHDDGGLPAEPDTKYRCLA